MTDRRELDRALANPEAAPLGRYLQDELDEQRVLGMWRRIDTRLAQSTAPRSSSRWLALAAAVLVAFVFVVLRRAPVQELNLSSGAAPVLLEATTGKRYDFADGSRIELASEGRLEVLRNDAHVFMSALRRGSGTFEIKPGGPRKWVIEAGLASIEVIGTRFKVERTPDRVQVEVERGVVLVRAESLPGGARRLQAGEKVEVQTPQAREAQAAQAEPPLQPSSIPVVSVDELGTVPSSAAPAAPSAKPNPAAHGPDVIDELLALADTARARNDSGEAIRLLEEVMRIAPPRDPRRGMAALTLARLTAEREPARAAETLDKARDSMPEGLAQDALARQVMVEGQAGNRARAAELAREYLRRFPNGVRAAEVKRWLEP